MKTIRQIPASVFVVALLVFTGFFSFIGTGQGAEAVLSTAPSSSRNPLIGEMRTLDVAFRNIVSDVALGERTGVRSAIASMHGTMEATHEGIHGGTVALPKNGDRMAEFMKRDHKFHEMLEALDHAAERNHPQEMLRITKQLLDGCVQCHRLFRK